MGHKPLKQYSGRLSAEQIVAGINAAARNARRLYEDAELLLNQGRYPTACALAALSIEESGKAAILRRLSIAKTDQRAKEIWREYRNHRSKNVMWILPDLAVRGARTIEDMRVIVDPNSDHGAVLDTVKQLGFYTDCCGSAHWSEPPAVIDEKLAQTILFTAKVLLRKKDMPLREMELWIEHIGPSIDGEDSFDDLLRFYEALHGEGLSEHSLEDIRAFIAQQRSEERQ